MDIIPEEDGPSTTRPHLIYTMDPSGPLLILEIYMYILSIRIRSRMFLPEGKIFVVRVQCIVRNLWHEINISTANITHVEPLEVYGLCISTTSWEDWLRHRKVLAAPFNEKILKLVWNETLKQSNEMLQSWIENVGRWISSVAKDTWTLWLKVLAVTGFRQSYQICSSTRSDASEAQTYRDALRTVLDHALLLMLIPSRVLHLLFVLKSWKRLGKTAVDFIK